jgi:hypothetical protein
LFCRKLFPFAEGCNGKGGGLLKTKRAVKCIRCGTYISPQEWQWFKEEGSLPICDQCCFEELDDEGEKAKQQ